MLPIYTIQTHVFAKCTDRWTTAATEKYSKTTCGVKGRDRTQLVWIAGIASGAVGLLAFGLRVMARVFVGANSWGVDDWLMTGAVVSKPVFPLLSDRGRGLTCIVLHDTFIGSFDSS